MATYREIQRWVKPEYGFVPKTCWIAHCKELMGIPLRAAWNRSGERQETCPNEKRAMLFAAFRNSGIA